MQIRRMQKEFVKILQRFEKFLLVPGLAWHTALRKDKVKWDLLTGINMLLMIKIGIRGRICHFIYQYGKANNK